MWGCFLMSGVKILHFLKDWWKSIPIHQNYTMALLECWWLYVFKHQHFVCRHSCSHMHRSVHAEADPGSVKRGGWESKFLDAAPENINKSAKKGGGGRGRFAPPWIRHWHGHIFNAIWAVLSTLSIKRNLYHFFKNQMVTFVKKRGKMWWNCKMSFFKNHRNFSLRTFMKPPI